MDITHWLLIRCCSVGFFPWTKGPPFRTRQFQNIFHEWNVSYFDSNFTEFCSKGSNRQYISICSGNGLTPNRWQVINWTTANPAQRRTYAALGEWELRNPFHRVVVIPIFRYNPDFEVIIFFIMFIIWATEPTWQAKHKIGQANFPSFTHEINFTCTESGTLRGWGWGGDGGVHYSFVA